MDKLDKDKIFIGFLIKSGEIITEEVIRMNIKIDALSGDRTVDQATEAWKNMILLASAHNIRFFKGGGEK